MQTKRKKNEKRKEKRKNKNQEKEKKRKKKKDPQVPPGPAVPKKVGNVVKEYKLDRSHHTVLYRIEIY